MKTKILLLAALSALVITGCTNVREIGEVNGLKLTRVTTRGVFSPSTTTVLAHNPNHPGTISGHVANAQGPGFLPAVAQAAGTAGGAALLRPSTTKVENGSNANSFSNSSASNGGASITVNANAGGSNTQNGAVHHNTGNGNGSGNNGNGN